jgi:UDP:flavonoid glycosyltransferase YjiC (YdhE family)
MRFLFVTWGGGGNSTPVLGLATRLLARGHEVKVVSPDDMRARFSAVGIAYEVLVREPGAVLALIERESPSVVIVDFMWPEWMSEAEASGAPWVALVHTLYDRVAVGILTAFTTLDQINASRARLGLDRLSEAAEILDRATRVLVTAPPALDSSTDVPANVVFVGAILEERGPDTGWRPPPGEGPLVSVSLGTTPGLDEGPPLQRVLDAFASRPLRGLVNLSSYVDVSMLEVPPNVMVDGYVRHAAVLPHVRAMINHAGLGSIVAALSHGVPMLCVPLDRDQPHNASRVEALGTGIVVSRDASTVEIGQALDQVLEDPGYRASTRPFAESFDPEAEVAIAELEAAGVGGAL